MAQLVKNPPAMRETWVQSLGWEDPPGEGKGCPLQYFGLGHKESDMTERLALHFTPLHFTIIKETKSVTETLSTKKISGPNGSPVELYSSLT